MTNRDRASFQAGTNSYVPGMQYSHDVVHGQGNAFSLGTPAAVSATNIAAADAANAVATTEVAHDITLDGTYGRTLRVTPSGNPGNAAAVDIFGIDYLGQQMAERFTGASGATAILYGQKAFKKIIKSKIVTAASNAVNWAVGTGFRLGLPYKGDAMWAKENGAFAQLYKRDTTLWIDWDTTDAVAGRSKFVRAEFPGYVNTLIGIPDAGGGAADPVVTVKLATVAIVGLTVTIDTSDTTGLTVTDTPTTVGYSANNRFRPNDMIEVVAAAAAAAFGNRMALVMTPTQFSPAILTDPQTLTAGDPRGTYEPIFTPDGVGEIVVGLTGDPAVNGSNNGGLHGIKHVIA